LAKESQTFKPKRRNGIKKIVVQNVKPLADVVCHNFSSGDYMPAEEFYQPNESGSFTYVLQNNKLAKISIVDIINKQQESFEINSIQIEK
jgi:hypothetical protein